MKGDIGFEVACEDANLYDTVLRAARDLGCVSPTIGECSNGTVCVVDTDNGKTYKIELREF